MCVADFVLQKFLLNCAGLKSGRAPGQFGVGISASTRTLHFQNKSICFLFQGACCKAQQGFIWLKRKEKELFPAAERRDLSLPSLCDANLRVAANPADFAAVRQHVKPDQLAQLLTLLSRSLGSVLNSPAL